jgi:hypothetical protein
MSSGLKPKPSPVDPDLYIKEFIGPLWEPNTESTVLKTSPGNERLWKESRKKRFCRRRVKMKENGEEKRVPEISDAPREGGEAKKGKRPDKKAGADAAELDYCRFAADPEHERGYREEEPCDDAREGDYEKTTRK